MYLGLKIFVVHPGFFSAFGMQTNNKIFGVLKIFVSWHAKHEAMYIGIVK